MRDGSAVAILRDDEPEWMVLGMGEPGDAAFTLGFRRTWGGCETTVLGEPPACDQEECRKDEPHRDHHEDRHTAIQRLSPASAPPR
jgi:hypothetical protein